MKVEILLDNLLKEDEVDLGTRKVDEFLVIENGDVILRKTMKIDFLKYRSEYKSYLGMQGCW